MSGKPEDRLTLTCSDGEGGLIHQHYVPSAVHDALLNAMRLNLEIYQGTDTEQRLLRILDMAGLEVENRGDSIIFKGKQNGKER